MAIERGICAAPSYLDRRGTPRGPADLADHDALIFTLAATPQAWTLQRGEARETVTVQGRFRANNSLALRDAAMAGSGLAFIPLIYARDALADGQLVRLLPDWSGEPHHLYGVYPAHRETSHKLRLFLDFLVEELAALDARG